MAWRDDARVEIVDLKPHFVEKYGWQPRLVESDDAEALELFVRLRSRRHPDRVFVLRLRYKEDWQTAGRRESFVDPDDPEREGIEHWPTGVSGVKLQHSPPCICLRGTWGYHSVLHTDHLMGDTTLLNLLVELQTVLDQ